jgi:uncharacterized membrane protein YhaH (DUF805 family)
MVFCAGGYRKLTNRIEQRYLKGIQMNGPGPEAVAPVFAIIMFLVWLLIIVASTVIGIIIYCKLFSKAGYPWALGLLILVPIANIVMLCYLAFADWPVLKELRQLRQQQYPNNPPAS